MSATSGPLGDHLEEGFIDDDNVGPKGETIKEREENIKEGGSIVEGGKIENGEKVEQESKA